MNVISEGGYKSLSHKPLSSNARVFRPRRKLYNIDGTKVLATSSQSAVAALIDFKVRMQ